MTSTEFFCLAFVFVIAQLFCWYFVPVMIVAAKKLGMLDLPDGKIKNHSVPVPYLGGVAVYIAFIAPLALFLPFESTLIWFLLGTTFLLFIGLVDDFNVLTPSKKFLGQLFAVICFLKGGIYLKSQFFSRCTTLFISGFWMLSVINAFNLVDVMDGLSSSMALVAAATFFVISLILGNYSLAVLFVAILGALIPFLYYNRHPARIYLGDAGSLFLGGFVSASPLLFSWTKILSESNAFPSFAIGSLFFEMSISIFVPMLIVGLPAIEIISLIIIRFAKGLPVYCGSPHHFASYLKNRGWGVRKILLFSVGCSIFLSLLALFFMFGKISFYVLISGIFTFFLFWIYFLYF